MQNVSGVLSLFSAFIISEVLNCVYPQLTLEVSLFSAMKSLGKRLFYHSSPGLFNFNYAPAKKILQYFVKAVVISTGTDSSRQIIKIVLHLLLTRWTIFDS